MMHKACCGLEEVPCCFSRSSIKFQGETGQKIADFDLKQCLIWLSPHQQNMQWNQKGCSISMPAVSLGLTISSWAFPDCNPSFSPFTDGFETMHKAWCSLEEVHYCFSRLSIKFHWGWKIDDFKPIWVKLPGQSQLSNPSDLPCLSFHAIKTFTLVPFFAIWT